MGTHNNYLFFLAFGLLFLLGGCWMLGVAAEKDKASPPLNQLLLEKLKHPHEIDTIKVPYLPKRVLPQLSVEEEPVTTLARSINSMNISILVMVKSSLWDCSGQLDVNFQPWQIDTQLSIPSCINDQYFKYSLSNNNVQTLQPTYYYDVTGVGVTQLFVKTGSEIFAIVDFEYDWVDIYTGYLFQHYYIATTAYTYCGNVDYSYACNNKCYRGPGVCCNGVFCGGSSCCGTSCCAATADVKANHQDTIPPEVHTRKLKL